ncbi:MAG: hypothetical protein FWH54_06895 [Methanobrevibacter sp.]|nr:hypothetical protein [Methanobrevibacter sp.]
MITITKKEKIVFNQIKIFHLEYDEGIPENLIRMELGIYEHELNEILSELANKKLIIHENKKIKLKNFDKELVTVDSKKEAVKAELDNKEKKSLEMIKNLVDENNIVSRYTLEGNLLYGELKLSDFRMFHILLSLENKNIIKKIEKNDGEYYILLE